MHFVTRRQGVKFLLFLNLLTFSISLEQNGKQMAAENESNPINESTNNFQCKLQS